MTTAIRSLKSWCPHCQENVPTRERAVKNKDKKFTKSVEVCCANCGLTLQTYERPRGGNR
jgi:hypothetical protein